MYSEQMHYAIQKLKEMAAELGRVPMISDFKKKFPNINVVLLFGSYDGFLKSAGLLKMEEQDNAIKPRQPRILVLDIETKPLVVYAWGLFDQNIGLDQIIEDWSVMSWAAKWVGDSAVMYQDVSAQNDYKNDELIVHGIHELLNQADVVITQNGIRFDIPKLNGKFLKYKLGPPTPYKHIDTMKIKRKLGLTSKKLAYTTNYFNENFKKLNHGKFSGFSLWKECLNRNMEAWAEMKEYNIHDVLALEELYLNHLIAFDNTINYGVYTMKGNCCPNCGSDELKEREYGYTKIGAFKNYQCGKCGTQMQSKANELSSAVKKSLLK